MPPGKKGKPAPADLPRTIAHHLDQAAKNMGHGLRHLDEGAKAPTAAARNFNLKAHAKPHLEESGRKITKATEAIVKKVPAVGVELRKLQAATPETKPLPKSPSRKPAGRKR